MTTEQIEFPHPNTTISARRIKWGYGTHRLELPESVALAPITGEPEAGDFAVVSIETIGRHLQIEGRSSQKIRLFPGDLVAGVFGHRYATEQYEGYAGVRGDGTLDLLGQAALLGLVKSRRVGMPDPTTARLVGRMVDPKGRLLRLAAHRLHPLRKHMSDRCRTILVVGATMDAGKTTAAAHITLGLSRSGARVAAAKVTGTICGNDTTFFRDAGADPVLDFSFCGVPSTYLCSATQLEGIWLTLRSHLLAARPDAIVLEIADGLFQRETRILLESAFFTGQIDEVVVCAADPLAAAHGVARMQSLGYHVAAVGGVLTASPLAVRETALATELPVLTSQELAAGQLAGLARAAAAARA